MDKLKLMVLQQKILHAQEDFSALHDNTIIFINKLAFSAIDNKLHPLKDMLKQPNKKEPIKEIDHEADAYECRNH